MNVKRDFIISFLYLGGTVFIVVATHENLTVGTLCWTRLVVLYLMGLYAVLNLVTFIVKGLKRSLKEPISTRSRYSQYLELVMGMIFIATLVYNWIAK